MTVRFFRVLAATALFTLPLADADVRGCACDLSRPETMAARACSLCLEAEMRPADEPLFFFIKDASPTKPNRWLALPRFHGKGAQELADMTPEQRTAYWAAAIAKATELWGNQWGLAINSVERRTQCHAHIHIGKLLNGVEKEGFVLVDGPAAIPVVRDGSGLWVHPAGNKLHAHMREVAPELVLQR